MKKGFTLVELLVVVSIIAILSLIGLTIFTNVQKGARDARRKADVDSIVKAYEGKYQPLTGKYPALLATDFSAGKIPTPPEEGNYTGCSSSEVEGFKICATLESGGTFCQGSSQGTPPSSSTGTCGVVIAGGTPSPTPTPAAVLASKPLDCENFGDMDKNGQITTNDIDIISKYIDNLLTPTQDEKIIADVSYDGSLDLGTLNSSDALHLTRYLNNDISHLNVCSHAKVSPCGSIGDATGDGKVTPMDVQEASRIAVGGFNSLYTGQPYTPQQKANADVNASGNVNSTDALFISNYLAGTITTFPACP